MITETQMTVHRIRVVDLETAGSGPYDVCEIGWQDVVKAGDTSWAVSGECGALFVNPGRLISPETMAVHHIIDEYVAAAPFWKELAPAVLQPEGGAIALSAHRAAFEQRYCTPRLTGGAKWICTWKCALRLWPHLQSFSNQMLRYQRKPSGLVHETGLPAHRAFPDAYVTAHHLRDMLNQASFEQLLEWSNEPALLPRVPTGAQRGKSWTDISDESLQAFSHDRDVDIRFTAENEMRRRGNTVRGDEAPPEQGQLL